MNSKKLFKRHSHIRNHNANTVLQYPSGAGIQASNPAGLSLEASGVAIHRGSPRPVNPPYQRGCQLRQHIECCYLLYPPSIARKRPSVPS